MKKVYSLLLLAAFSFSVSGFAQKNAKGSLPVGNLNAVQQKNVPANPLNTSDTITAHWDVIYPAPSVDTPVTYFCSATQHSYVAGHNQYSDKAKAQLFDSQYGVSTTNGTITNLLMWVGAKLQNAGTGSWVPTIWADNAGSPGSVLGTASAVTVAQMDTANAALGIIGPLTALKGAYNVNASFSPAIAIPSGQKFWAGFTINYAAGDSAGLITSRDGNYTVTGNGNFNDAATHTKSQWSDNSWHDFVSDWGLEIALAVYPVLDLVSTTGINEQAELSISSQCYPNPAVDMAAINFNLSKKAEVEIAVYSLTGERMYAEKEGQLTAGNHQVSLDLSNIPSGMYFYTIKANDVVLNDKMLIAK